MGVSKTSDHIQIKIKMPYPCQEPLASSKLQNRTYRTRMFFAPSKSRHRVKIRIIGVSKTSDHIQIKLKMPNPSQETPASSKAPNEDFKDMDILCTLKIKIDTLNWDNWCVKYKWPYLNQDQDAKSQSGTSINPKSPKSGLQGHRWSLHLQSR